MIRRPDSSKRPDDRILQLESHTKAKPEHPLINSLSPGASRCGNHAESTGNRI